jgi:hypothetical protein
MKLPARIAKLVNQVNDEQIPHLASIIRRHKAYDESLPTWYRDQHVKYYEGLLWGAFATIEQLLMAYNCYHGFGYCNNHDDENERRYTIR